MLNFTVVNWMFYFYEESVFYNIRNIQSKPIKFQLEENKWLFVDLNNQRKPPENCVDTLTPVRIHYYDEFRSCETLLPLSNENVNKKLLSSKYPWKGFVLKHKESDIRIYFKCDKSRRKTRFELNGLNLMVSSPSACGKTLTVGKFINKQKHVISAILVAFGVVLLFFGGLNWQYVVPVIGFFVGAFAIFFGSQILIIYTLNLANAIIVTICSIAVGVLLACISVFFVQMLHFFIGFAAGFTLGFIFVGTIIPGSGQMASIVAGAVVGVWVGLMCAHTAGISIMMMTAMLGSYLIVESLGFLAGWSPDYFKLLPTLRETCAGGWGYYGTLLGISALGVIGFFAQRSRTKSI